MSTKVDWKEKREKKTVTMTSGCMNSVSCMDAQAPVRATYVNLYKWPESDAEFVKSVTKEKKDRGNATHNQVRLSRTASGRRRLTQSPGVVDSYSCRQMYLRSYTFSKKETVPEKTKKCLAKVKERASLFAKDTSSNASVSSYGSRKSNTNTNTNTNTKKVNDKKKNNKKKKKKKKKKGCVAMVKRIKDVSCSAFFSLFRRLLSCTSTVDVIDNRPSQ
ncbi:Cyclophilin-like domain-containing protein [Dioscorea alata]|uniref:Cyclophilin-like domain-containing protein n=1 Tax=Dioscorea alata TaxID=55571 RepID=A0ACB7VU87_DIOAL|nr:Cyclophilin-like domain-containing protein [Dioscorea alata]